MPFDRFLIAPFDTGLQTDTKAWLIMDDAFAQLTNAYVFRGRVRKRFGSVYTGSGATSAVTEQLFSRLSYALGTTDGSGNISGTVPGDIFKVGQAFSVGNEIFTVTVTGTPGTMLTTGSSTVHTYNTSTGAYVIHGAAINTELYFYPAEPVMGLTNYEVGFITNQPSYAFDTQFAYVYSGGFWQHSGTATSPIWHGNNNNFFWAYNWQGITPNLQAMFVTNFQANVGAALVTDDPIWSFNGTTWTPYSYSPNATINPTNIQPLTVTSTTSGNNAIIANYVQTARIIVAFKDRLVLLNTIENNANGATQFNSGSPTTTGITPTNYLTSTNMAFTNRARYSHNGSPFSVTAWLEPNVTYNPGGTGVVNADGGGFIDAPTDEQIVSAEFIKDRLIVYFERSTWELAYTGNQILPFVWQKINTELGSEATFSSVPFDKVILTMGTTGVHACNGANVQRIDDKIPDEVFEIANRNEGVQRVAGIRDYYTEMVYWTFPSSNENPTETFPNQILVYNYKNGSWALNTDCITVWGYFEQQNATTWANSQITWEDENSTWSSGALQTQFRQIIAGNQQGFVLLINSDYSANAPGMQISGMAVSGSFVNLTIVDHTLTVGEYVYISNAQGVTGIDGNIYPVYSIISANNILIGPASFTGTYTGGGNVTRVSNIEILTKQFNPYVDQDRNVYIHKIDFGVRNTGSLASSGTELTIDYYASYSELSMVNEATQTGTIMGTNVLATGPYPDVPFEQYQQQLWHPIYFQVSGQAVQFYLYMAPAQITNPSIAFNDFELYGMTLFTTATTDRLS